MILITPDHPTMRHTFAIDDDLQVTAFPHGIGITLRTTGELHIAKFGERFILLPAGITERCTGLRRAE